MHAGRMVRVRACRGEDVLAPLIGTLGAAAAVGGIIANRTRRSAAQAARDEVIGGLLLVAGLAVLGATLGFAGD